MDIKEQLKQLRKNCAKTQKGFGELLGVTRDTYASYESGRVIPSQTFIQLLCSEFNVNEEWLRTGNGEMFNQTKTTIIEKLSAQYNLSYYGQKMIETYLNLDKGQQEAIDGFFKAFAESCNTASDISDISDVNVDDTIKLYHAAKSERNTESE